MEDLRDLFAGLGCGEVRTLLNSGNVVFSGPKALTESGIEDAFTRRFGFSSRITLLEAAELIAAIEENPLSEIADPTRFLVALLKTPGHREHLSALAERTWHPEAFALGARAAYMWCPAGVSASPLNQAVAKVLGDSVTARNWATVLKLRALLPRSG
jgi:uncharacterized protein (DUF1697 family)